MSGHGQRLLRVTALAASPAAYGPILRLQELLFEHRKAGLIPDTFLQLEVRGASTPDEGCWPPPPPISIPTHRNSRKCAARHPAASPRPLTSCPLAILQHQHVYTMGKRGSPADFHVDAARLARAGVDVYTTPRGGETTYHGPGQLVVYPIVSLRGLGIGARAYVEGLEDVMVRTLGRYGVAARVRLVPVAGCFPWGWAP